jgi:hypothetical protein
MARTDSKELTAARRRQAALRTHYREFLVTRDGRRYNPLLDDVNHPDNARHWAHGSPEGYHQAGCQCAPCDEAGRKENQRKTEARIAKRRDAHRAVASEVLAARFPGLSSEEVTEAAAKVVAVGEVTNRTQVRINYGFTGVVLALDNWALRGGHDIDADTVGALAEDLIERMSS